MNKIGLVVKQELSNTLRRPTYVFFAVVLPMLIVLVLLVVNFLQQSDTGSPASNAEPGQFALQKEGYVDLAGVILTLPPDMPPDVLRPYATEQLARQALEAGEIDAYYIIPQDYIDEGEIAYIYPSAKSLLDDGQPWVIQRALMFNLMGGDLAATDRIWNPVRQLDQTQLAPDLSSERTGEDCSRPGTACESNELIRLIPSIIVVLFFFSFLTSGNLLFGSVTLEKENRTLEMLLVSLTPRQLLAGKSIAGGLAGLLQIGVWLASAALFFSLGGSTISFPAEFTFPTAIIIWGIIFFLGGFAVYAGLMAGMGAMVSKMKEAGAASFIIITPLFVGYVVGLLAPLAGAAHDTLPLILSIFPLTSPIVMIMRLTDGTVPLWQLLTSAALLLATAFVVQRAVAAMFRAHYLLSGQPFSLARYLRTLFGVGGSARGRTAPL